MYKSFTKLEQYAAAGTLIVRHNVCALMRRIHNVIAKAWFMVLHPIYPRFSLLEIWFAIYNFIREADTTGFYHHFLPQR